MTPPVERTDWHGIAVGIVIGALAAIIPFAVVALMVAAGVWMGSW